MGRKNSDIRHRLSNGKYIKVIYEELYGLYEPECKQITILKHKDNSGYEELDTIIHELLHAEMPKWTEQKVFKTANSISSLLWKLGYRKKNKKT